MDYTSFIKRIRSVEKTPQRYFIVDPDLPLSVYFGLDSVGRPTLLIEDIGKTFRRRSKITTTHNGIFDPAPML